MRKVVLGLGGLGLVAASIVVGCGGSGSGIGGAGGTGGAGVTSSTTATHATSVTSGPSTTATSATSTTTSVATTSVASTSVASTSQASTTNVSATATASSTTGSTSASTGTGGAPPTWTCNPNFFGSNDGCDCGCGAFDPDCPTNTLVDCADCSDPGGCSANSNGCPGFIDPNNTAGCVAPTPENTLALCTDGIDNDQDGLTDCDDPNCNGFGTCPPLGWTCIAAGYNAADGCNCGCGIPDPDCTDALATSCDVCDDTGSCSVNSGGCPGFISPNNNTACIPIVMENTDVTCSDGIDNDQDGLTDCSDPNCLGHSTCAPLTWTCEPGFFNDGGCDCGCGAADVDCADATLASCEFCRDTGSCNTTSCTDPACTINPTNNAHCN